MKVNIPKKKHITEKNLKDIIKIGINFGERLNQISEKCVDDYNTTTMYNPKMLCIYDDYIWECKFTTQGEFDNTKWEKLSDELTEIDKDTLKTMLDLTTEQIDTISKILLDSEIRLDKTWSSSKIYTDIQQCLSDSKTYTLKELSKKMGASYKVVSTTSEVTSTEFLYLISNSTAYDIYALIDGVATKLGDTTIDLSNYYTKNEIDSDFLKKTDADIKYATQTSFNTHISDTDIHITSDERAKWNEVDNKVNKTDISTTIDSTSTNTQVSSAKTTYDLFKSLNTKIYGGAVNTDILTYAENLTSKGFFPIQVDSITNINVPHFAFSYTNGFIMRTGATKDNTRITVVLFPRKDSEPMGHYIAVNTKYNSDAWTGWRYYGSTSVADVSETYITSYLDETYVKPTNTNTNSYSVTNGICEVRIEANCLATTNKLTKIVSGLPKVKNIKYANAVNRNQTLNTNASALFMIAGSDLYVTCNYGDTSVSGSRGFYVSFTYPVAES